MRKLLIYLSIVAGFIFCFFNANKINILAISSFDNNIGTLPIQIDIDNYNRENLLDLQNVSGTTYKQITNIKLNLDNNKSYKFCSLVNTTATTSNISLVSFYSGSIQVAYVNFRNSDNFTCYNLVWTENNNNITSIYFYASNNYNNSVGFNFSFNDNVIVERDIIVDSYIPYFKFGYILSGDIQLLCPNENVTENISLLIFNNEDLLYKSNYFNGSSCGYIRFDNVYLPFNINNKGNVSFNLNLRFMIDGWGAGLYTLDYGSKLVLTPIYEAYYKGEFANDNIYTKLSYTSNNIYYNGYNLEYSDGSTNLFYFLGNKNILGYNLSIEEAKFNKNIASDYLININNYNKFSFNNFLNFPLEIYLFSGNENTTLMSMTSTNIYISFSSISSRVNNNQSTTTPLPDNELTIDKYNNCSAWYDIPCQLGNAVTYVIYEAPIISPIVEFVMTFVNAIEYLLEYITWFEGFGILFSLFIFIMLIRILIMIIKGSNDDRGSK